MRQRRTMLREIISWRQRQENDKLFNIIMPDTSDLVDEFNFLEYYNDNYGYFDNYINFMFGFRLFILDMKEGDIEQKWSDFNSFASSIIGSKAYEYQRIWDALKADYNPIENYDKNSEITTETDEAEDEHEHGTHTDTIDTPEITNTHSGGTQTDTLQDSPHDNNNFYNKSKSETVVPQTTDKVSAHIITNTAGTYTDTDTIGKRKTTVKERTHGNIGVTTNQQMITSELEMRKNNFIIGILTDVINHSTIY